MASSGSASIGILIFIIIILIIIIVLMATGIIPVNGGEATNEQIIDALERGVIITAEGMSRTVYTTNLKYERRANSEGIFLSANSNIRAPSGAEYENIGGNKLLYSVARNPTLSGHSGYIDRPYNGMRYAGGECLVAPAVNVTPYVSYDITNTATDRTIRIGRDLTIPTLVNSVALSY
jgi:hypothetical protein